MNNSMINPSIDELLEKVENRYTLVCLTSKRARQLIEGSEALIKMDSIKPVTIALNEVNKKVLTYKAVKEGIK